MNRNRILTGWTCLGLAFVVIVLLATGVVESPGLRAARSLGELLAGFAVPVLIALALFVAGLWLIKKPRHR